jgi:hypothetical protein
VLAGVFARVDFATDWGFCAQFAREIARLARLDVENSSISKSSAGESNQDSINVAHPTSDSIMGWNNTTMDNTVS